MLNEGVYRSPKWLRKSLDYEVHTGEDIKGNVSKREVRNKALAEEKARISKEKAESERFKREWNGRWINKNDTLFKKFYKEEFPTEVKTKYNDYIYNSDLENIRIKWENNPDLWIRYDKWRKKVKEEEEDQNRIKRDLDDLYHGMLNDFYNNPYRDKISTQVNGGVVGVTYRFENGDVVKINDRNISYKGSVYTVGLAYKSKFVALINKMISDMKNRPNGSSSGSSNSSNSNSSRGTKTKYY